MPLIILIAFVILVLVLTLLRRRSGRDLMKPPADLAVRSMPDADQAFPFEIDAAMEAEIRTLLDRNQKINAVKLIRETMGLSLKQSKDLAERFEI